MLSPDLGVSNDSSISSSDANPTGVRLPWPCEPYCIESERPRLGVMDREPSPPPELKYEDAEVEQERGMSRPFINEEDEEVDEYGVEGFR